MPGRTICTLLFQIPLWILIAAPLRADVTVRYDGDVKMTAPPGQPAAAGKAMRDNLSHHNLLRMKNGKICSAMGPWTHIVDYTTQQMTIVDNAHKTYAQFPMAEIADKVSSLMPQPQWPDAVKKAMEGIKTTVDSKKTGKTETILGIEAEETETVITMSMPGPAGGAGYTTKVVLQVWNAKAGETLRNQAVREFTGYNIWSNYFINPTGMMEKMFGKMPGFVDSFKVMIDAMSKNQAVMLRMRMAMFMRSDTPIFESNSEAVELSSAPVEDAIFQIPSDYQAVPADELLKRFVVEQAGNAAK